MTLSTVSPDTEPTLTLQDAREVLEVAAALGPVEAIAGMTVWRAEHVSFSVMGAEQVKFLGVYATKEAATRAMRNYIARIWGLHSSHTVSFSDFLQAEPDFFQTTSDEDMIFRYLQETFSVHCRIVQDVLVGQPEAIWVPEGAVK